MVIRIASMPFWLPECVKSRYWFVFETYGYVDYIDVAGVITNYSLAHIPLETMWTDIGEKRCPCTRDRSATELSADYMYKRRVFTLDPDYFPLPRMQEIVNYLHSHDQRYGKS